MRHRPFATAVASVFLLGLLLAGPASAKVFSSGDIDRRLPDLGRVASTIKVPSRGKIADISVKVRMSHGYTSDILMGIQLPDGEFEELVSQGAAYGTGGTPRDFGTGAKSCKGQVTTFNDDAPTAIADGTSPFLGNYRPSESMSVDGENAKGAYRLIAFDTNQDQGGTLHCWKLDIDFVP